MVERLKAAVEKARERRMSGSGILAQGAGAGGELSLGAAQEHAAQEHVAQGQVARDQPAAPAQPAAPVQDAWSFLEEVTPDTWMLERERIVTRDKSDPAHVAFDNLRTRLRKALHTHGWSRVAITSPTKGCGKTMVAANLAFSFARQADTRTMLVDMDLRAPSMAPRLGIREMLSIEDFLTGEIAPEDYLRRVGDNLVLGLNAWPVRDSAELVQSRRAVATLDWAMSLYRPHVVIYDLPPMLVGDDVIAFLPNVDAVLLVAAAGQTRPAEISECERLISEHSRFLGVLLNKSAEKAAVSSYDYGS